jgi:hypothetical protein
MTGGGRASGRVQVRAGNRQHLDRKAAGPNRQGLDDRLEQLVTVG